MSPTPPPVRGSQVGPAPSPAMERVACVLSGCRFPAARWELMTYADHYGADVCTREDLRALPPGPFADLAEVLVHVTRPRGAAAARLGPARLAPVATRPARAGLRPRPAARQSDDEPRRTG